MKKSLLVTIGALVNLVAVSAGLYYWAGSGKKEVAADTVKYLEQTYKIERDFIENVPIYRDFTSRAKEAKLRTYLIAAHRSKIKTIAERFGIRPFHNTAEIKQAIKADKLVSIDDDPNKLYYFYNVKKEYRYLNKMAKKGLQLLGERFQKNLQKKKAGLPPVKLAISSVIRPVDYQKKLFNRAFVSTHSYGTTFDIFFEDFLVVLPPIESEQEQGKVIGKKIKRRLGFLLGDALRRQLHAILMQTLIELQDEGKLYAILEIYNRCYHVTIIN